MSGVSLYVALSVEQLELLVDLLDEAHSNRVGERAGRFTAEESALEDYITDRWDTCRSLNGA